MLKNKKAAERSGFQTAAKKMNRADSFTLSDKIRILLRFLSLKKVYKDSIFYAINSLYNEALLEKKVCKNK